MGSVGGQQATKVSDQNQTKHLAHSLALNHDAALSERFTKKVHILHIFIFCKIYSKFNILFLHQRDLPTWESGSQTLYIHPFTPTYLDECVILYIDSSIHYSSNWSAHFTAA